jgi:hypothetical protein
MRRLFETIESSLQLAHMRGKPIILKTWRLLHVDILGEKTMEESIADINLSQNPTMQDSNRENQTNYRRLHNGTESIAIINTMLLSETMGYKTSFVFID